MTIDMAQEVKEVKDSKAVSSDTEISTENNGSYHGPAIKTSEDGVVLIPHPSDDPRDPLVRILHVLCSLKLLLIRILELAFEQEIEDSGSHQFCSVCRICCEFGRSVTGCSAVRTISCFNNPDGIPGKHRYMLVIIIET
jgi:hypothetical protein